MAAERRSTFAQSGPLSPTQTGAPRYNRFNFRDYMKNHVKKLTEAELKKPIQMISSTSTGRTEEKDTSTQDKEPDTATAQQTEAKTRSRSTTPNGTRRKTGAGVYKTAQEKKDWIAKQSRQEAEAEDGAQGPLRVDIGTPDAPSTVRQGIATFETQESTKRSQEDADIGTKLDDLRRERLLAPEDPPGPMSSASGFFDPENDMGHFEGIDATAAQTPSFTVSPAKPKMSSRASSRSPPPPKAHAAGSRQQVTVTEQIE